MCYYVQERNNYLKMKAGLKPSGHFRVDLDWGHNHFDAGLLFLHQMRTTLNHVASGVLIHIYSKE